MCPDVGCLRARRIRCNVFKLLDATGSTVRVVTLDDFMRVNCTYRIFVDDVRLYLDCAPLMRGSTRWLVAHDGYGEHVVATEPGTSH